MASAEEAMEAADRASLAHVDLMRKLRDAITRGDEEQEAWDALERDEERRLRDGEEPF